MRPVLTEELVRAAAMDAGNRSMRKGGRTAWNKADYNASVREFNRLAPKIADPEARFRVTGKNPRRTRRAAMTGRERGRLIAKVRRDQRAATRKRKAYYRLRRKNPTKIRVGRKAVPLEQATIGQLQIAALKAFASSPYQKEIQAEIARRKAKGERVWTPPVGHRWRKNPAGSQKIPVFSERNQWKAVQLEAQAILTYKGLPARVWEAATVQKEIAEEMLVQLARGVHKNPVLGLALANPAVKVVRTLSRRLYSVAYKHSEDGKDYQHDFGPGTSVFLLSDGSVLLKGPKPIWKRF